MAASASRLSDFDRVPSSEWLSLHAQRLEYLKSKNIKFESNPAITAVHAKERGKPWRAHGERQVQEAQTRADKDILRRKIQALGKQTSKGLFEAFGVKVDASNLAAIIAEGYSARQSIRETEAQFARQRQAIATERATAEAEYRNTIWRDVAETKRQELLQARVDCEQAKPVKPSKARDRKGANKIKNDNDVIQTTELTSEDEREIHNACIAAVAEVNLQNEFPDPPRPEYDEHLTSRSLLYEACSRFDMPAVKRLLGIKTRDNNDTTLCPEVALKLR